MLTLEQVTEALAVFGEMHERVITERLAKIYLSLLGEEFTPDEWAATCRHVAKTIPYWPQPSHLSEARNAEQKADHERQAEAAWVELTDTKRRRCMVEPPGYTAYYTAGKVYDELGHVAVVAFDAAGGDKAISATSTTHDIARKSFVTAYCREMATATRATANLLPAASEQRQLSGEVSQRAAAKALLRGVQERTGVEWMP